VCLPVANEYAQWGANGDTDQARRTVTDPNASLCRLADTHDHPDRTDTDEGGSWSGDGDATTWDANSHADTA